MRVIRQFLFVLLCFAATASCFAATVRATGTSIFVNEVEVVKLRAVVGGRTPADRVTGLAALLESGLASGGVRVVAAGTSSRILVGEKPWLVVTPEEAKAAGSSAQSLASTWANAIRNAAALPPVQLSTRQIKAPAGGVRTVGLVGSQVQASTVRSSDEKVVRVNREGSTITLQGVAPGTAKVQVSAGSTMTSLDVYVQPLAAYFPQSLVANVTGDPASRDTVAGSLVAIVNSELRMVEGSQVFFTPPVVKEIGNGQSLTYQVKVRVAGPMCFPSEGMVTVTVRNTSLGYRSEAELWYSNNPESVKKPMRLFVAGLKQNQPVRLLYHHMNVTRSGLIMSVEAINNTATPARVLIIPGDAEPDQNPVTAGYEAGDIFVKAWSKYSGEIVTIPAYSILPISLRRTARNDTASGLCYLRLLEGPEQLVVRVEARTPSVVENKWKLAMASPTPWRIAGYKKIGDLATVPMPDTVHIYPHPFKEEDVAYTVGGPYGFVRIGQRPIARQDNQGALDGNFGVVYTITANLENNTATAADVEMVYEASAGYCAAIFMIDGDLRKTPFMKPKEETRMSRFRLEPHTSRSIRIVTVPLSGSAYPCTLTFRPLQATPKETSGASNRSKNSK